MLPEPLFSKYESLGPLGVGAFSQVLSVKNRRTDEPYALKVIEKQPMEVRNMMPQLQREVDILKAVDHSNVVELHHVVDTPSHLFAFFELCWGSLEDLVHRRVGAMEEEDAVAWLKQVADGLQYLHEEMGVIHRDVKPANLLVDGEQGRLRLCDFGWAAFESDDPSGGPIGTPQYAPPEMRPGSTSRHTYAVDLYSLGATTQHILLGRVPQGADDLPDDVSSEALEFMEELLSPDPRKRPRARYVSKTEFFINNGAGSGPLTRMFGQLWNWGMGATAGPKKAGKEAEMETASTAAPSSGPSSAPSFASSGSPGMVAAIPFPTFGAPGAARGFGRMPSGPLFPPPSPGLHAACRVPQVAVRPFGAW